MAFDYERIVKQLEKLLGIADKVGLCVLAVIEDCEFVAALARSNGICELIRQSICNFACSMCAVSKWDKGRRAADLALPHFLALLEEQVGLVEIKLNGIGEPLMQGDDYFGIDKTIVWAAVENELPSLKTQIEKIINKK